MSDEKTLKDDEIQTQRRVGRRRAFLRIGGVAAGAVGLVVGCGGRRGTYIVTAQNATDGDTGYRADPAGGGRGPTGMTDRDAGECADPANYGVAGSGLTDSDSGACADTAGNGRWGR